MSHKSVREFIRDRVIAIRDDLKFGYGRSTDFNQIKDKKYPWVWLDPLQSTINLIEDGGFTETYSLNLIFYRYDKPDSKEDEYKLILDQTDDIVQAFIRYLHNDMVDDTSSSVVFTTHNTAISNVNKTPVIKVTADCLTGWVLTFDLTVPDKFDYCSIYD